MKRKLTVAKNSSTTPAKPGAKGLLTDVREMILATRQTVAQGVNSALTALYWEIGRRIRQDVLQSKRAGYGEQIVAALGRQLEREFGRGYGEKNLHRMIQFATVFPDEKIVAALRRQLGWTHFKAIIPIADPLKRDFYAEMCRIERWSTLCGAYNAIAWFENYKQPQQEEQQEQRLGRTWFGGGADIKLKALEKAKELAASWN